MGPYLHRRVQLKGVILNPVLSLSLPQAHETVVVAGHHDHLGEAVTVTVTVPVTLTVTLTMLVRDRNCHPNPNAAYQ